MRFGFFSNGQRIYNVEGSFDEDLRELIVAEEIGLDEAWISEHSAHNWLPMGLPAPELLITKAAALTERIRFGTAVKRIALYPPQMVAIEAAVTDHLTHGRYNFGFGVGPPITKYEQWGIDIADAEARTLESFDLLMKCWHEPEPFDYQGQFFGGQNIDIYPKLRQKRLPIAVASGRESVLELAARYDGQVLAAWSFSVELTRKIAATFDQVCAAYGGPRRDNLTLARCIFVADTDEKAHEQIEPYFKQILMDNAQHMKRANASVAPTLSQVDPNKSFAGMLESGAIIAGSPATVIEGVRKLHREVGGFGRLLLVGGRDFATADQRDDSLRFFAEAVAPNLARLSHEVSRPEVKEAVPA